jgi:hypothetical protein
VKRFAFALATLALATAGLARVATADDQGSTLITVQWDAGASDGAPPVAATAPATATAAVAATAAEADAGAAAAPAADAGAAAAPEGKGKFRGDMAAYYRYVGLDLDVSGGGGYFWGERKNTSGVGFVKVRGGIMYASWPYIYSIGATFESNNLSPAAWGIQAEVTHIGAGVWLQLGGMVDWKARFAGTASVGWSIFGIEAQLRGYKDPLPDAAPLDFGYGVAILGKVRIPIGVILYVLSRK